MNLLGFDYPDELYYWLERDMWARRLPDGLVQIGITAFGVRISGNFFMCRPKPPETELAQGQTVAVVELNKSVVTVKTPVSGVVREVNPVLAERPETIEQDPYGAGWLVTLAPTNWEADLALLHHGAALPEAATRRMQLENLDFSEGGAA